ncbi:glycoside hydrolase [Teratosphaeria nubilosa]|uniref:Glycoside hydrolase n=1 Tax=Teratosphaeria nubilosa TaxID=161662 RepID=A0A6G1KXK0_9PEZI|nr:glycoside hydrolase [Teratosphaeria nubilosa]
MYLDLSDYWNILVGPISTAAINTVVAAAPVPSTSLVPPPPIYYSPWPIGHQAPQYIKNESWSFPKDFIWGVSGAAYQTEGAAKDGGKGPSIWDVYAHRVTDYVTNNYTGDVSTNSYYMYKDDIARISAMGVKAYSFSLSWSRIIPYGRGEVNQVAIDYYNDVINTCLHYNVTPMVTLYHWDTPLFLQNSYGGWLGEQMVDDFLAYATVAFDAFGDRVKYWFTVNEPKHFCGGFPQSAGYFKTFDIPDSHQPFYCSTHVVLAHAKAYHLGKRMLGNDSIISYKNNGGFKVPLTNSTDDKHATQIAWDYAEGWFSDPIYLYGDYGPDVKAFVSTFPLRNFTEGEKALIKGSADTYSIDAYSAMLISAPDGGVDECLANSNNPSYPYCYQQGYTFTDGWTLGAYSDPEANDWLYKTTDWIPAYLHYVADTWAGGRPVMVTEFGFAEPFESQKTVLQDILYDPLRSSYMRDYVQAISLAISEGVNVVGCMAWSLYDNFEWEEGYELKMGLQYVNFSRPDLKRYYKASFFEYKRMFDIYQDK